MLTFRVMPRTLFLLMMCAPVFAQGMFETNTKESLRGLSAYNQSVVWASGTHGTYLFTQNGGKSWTTGQVPGAEKLDFRGVVVDDEGTFLLSAGPGDQSRIYHSGHLGEHWDLQFTNQEPAGFLDCMAFFDPQHGLVVGDPVNGKFQILRTEDGGKSWHYADSNKMPAAITGEGAFAASNTCLTVQGKKNAWFVTGGAAARVFRSRDGGKSWAVSDSPIVHGPASAGVFSVVFRDAQHGVIAGGDYAKPEQAGANLATTSDGGRTWKLGSAPEQKYYSATCYVWAGQPKNKRAIRIFVTGSTVSAYSDDGLSSWQWSMPIGFNALACIGEIAIVAGSEGRIMRVEVSTRGYSHREPIQ